MSATAVDVWETIQHRLRSRLPQESFQTWFSRLRFQDCDGARLRLSVPNRYVKEWIESHYAAELLDAARAFDPSISQVLVGVENNGSGTGRCEPVARVLAETAPLAVSAPAAGGRAARPARRLESFVVGAANRLAHAACRAVIEAEQPVDNPLVLFGEDGLGKSHLLAGLAEALRAKQPGQRVTHVTAEEFANAFIQSAQDRRVEAFRQDYRGSHALLMDDVQFLAGKEKTQEEFLYTFECLQRSGRQIAVTCDAHPREVRRLDGRLAARLLSGLVVRLGPPDFALRVELLRAKAQARRLPLEQGVLELLASRIERSVLELEGVVNKLAALAAVEARPPDQQLALLALRELGYLRDGPLTHEEILAVVAERYRLEPDQIRGSRRHASLAQARFLAMYLAKQLTRHTLSEIGRFYGNRDHATVIHACRRIEEQLQHDEDLRAEVQFLRRSLGR